MSGTIFLLSCGIAAFMVFVFGMLDYLRVDRRVCMAAMMVLGALWFTAFGASFFFENIPHMAAWFRHDRCVAFDYVIQKNVAEPSAIAQYERAGFRVVSVRDWGDHTLSRTVVMVKDGDDGSYEDIVSRE